LHFAKNEFHEFINNGTHGRNTEKRTERDVEKTLRTEIGRNEPEISGYYDIHDVS
jgi:hypothetical protein